MHLSQDMIARLRERAGNAIRRTDTEEMLTNSVDSDEVIRSLPADCQSQSPEVQRQMQDYVEGTNSPLSGMVGNAVFGDGGQAKGLFATLGRLLGGRRMFAMGPGGMISLGGKRHPGPSPRPASQEAVDGAEAALGFPLPTDLRQFYLEVADGGVGPGDGLYSLNQLRAKWAELTNEPIGPRGQKWPVRLLPIHGHDWDIISVDRNSGSLVFWDVEEIEYGGWSKSFIEEAECLEAWLEKWLAKPSLEAKAVLRAARPASKQLSDEDWEAWAEENPQNREYMRRLEMFSMTAEERAAAGLPEEGWEDQVWEGFDLRAIKPPLPGFAKRKNERLGGKEGVG